MVNPGDEVKEVTTSDRASNTSRMSGSTATIEKGVGRNDEGLPDSSAKGENEINYASVISSRDELAAAEAGQASNFAEKRDEELTRTTSRASRLSRIVSRISQRETGKIIVSQAPLMDLDHGLVGWESVDDPAYPQNFAEARKYSLLLLISSITFVSPLASSMFAPAVEFVNEDFHNTSTILSSLVVSIFVLGYALGPLVLAPLSEIYGRRIILTGANAFFCVWQIGCALAPNLSALIVFRLLAGLGGSGCLTIGGGVISDLFRPDQRGKATALYSLGPLIGPVIGPIIGGFIGQRAGWRWIFWVLLIAGTLISIFIEIFTAETNHQVLIARKTERLRQELNRPELISCYQKDLPHIPSKSEVLKHGLIRPFKMLKTPIVFFLSLYMAVVYGLLYLLFTTITSVFIENYHWAADISGLAYVGIGCGFMIGMAIVTRISDATVVRLTKQNGGFEPEYRLQACSIFALVIPITFFWYGWSAYYHTHWIVPIIGLAPFGIGMIGVFIPIQTYIIDAYTTYAASGIATLTFTRSLFGAFLPLAGPTMYEAMGLGWGNSTLGFIGVALIPVPLLIFRYGKQIRLKFPVEL